MGILGDNVREQFGSLLGRTLVDITASDPAETEMFISFMFTFGAELRVFRTDDQTTVPVVLDLPEGIASVTFVTYTTAMADLNIRGIPDELFAVIKAQAALCGKTMKDFALEALRTAVAGGEKVTCPLCGLDGPLVRSGTNCRCFHCGAGFMMPEGS